MNVPAWLIPNREKKRASADGSPVPVGERDTAATSLAGQFLHEDMPLADVQRRLQEWNKTNDVPLGEEQVCRHQLR